jgi:hypothetical protein
MGTGDSEWQDYRHRKRLLWGGLFLYLPVTGSIGFALTMVGLTAGAGAFAIAWIALWAINGYQLSRFRCPECGQYFFMQSLGYIKVGNVWSTRCCHCGASPPPRSASA